MYVSCICNCYFIGYLYLTLAGKLPGKYMNNDHAFILVEMIHSIYGNPITQQGLYAIFV